jgi:hypothetical protein
MHKKLSMAFIAIFISSSLAAMEKESTQKISLLTSDNQVLKIDRTQADRSKFIKDQLFDCKNSHVLAAPEIHLGSKACTKAVVDLLFSLIDTPHDALVSNAQALSFENLLNLFEAFNYLDIETKKIFPICQKSLADKIIQEKDSENLKHLIELIKQLPPDLQKLVKDELIAKKLSVPIDIGDFFIDGIEPAEISRDGWFSLLVTRIGAAYYLPLVPPSLLNASLEQCIIMVKALDMPSILQDNYYQSLVANLYDKLLKHITNRSKKDENNA